jgi:FkbM family methyltransferase
LCTFAGLLHTGNNNKAEIMIKKIKSGIKKKVEKIRFNLSAANSNLFLGYYKYFYKPKKNSLHAFLHEYSLSLANKLYVIQIGANDGITHDPIHKFIKRDNWRGVLLEPQSYVYETFLKKIYAKNRGIHTLCAAIGPEDGKQQLYKIGFSNMRWATGLASFQKENVEKAFSSGYVQAKCMRYQIPLPDESEYIISDEVTMISPETLMKNYSIAHIDLLQIDAEGYDYEVIKMFKIQQFRPRAIVFEHTHLSEDDKTSCFQHLKANEYKIASFGSNTVAMLSPVGSFSKYFKADNSIN